MFSSFHSRLAHPRNLVHRGASLGVSRSMWSCGQYGTSSTCWCMKSTRATGTRWVGVWEEGTELQPWEDVHGEARAARAPWVHRELELELDTLLEQISLSLQYFTIRILLSTVGLILLHAQIYFVSVLFSIKFLLLAVPPSLPQFSKI